MSWRDRLVTAALSGFEFLTESHDAKGGRRLVVSEYPGGEEASVRDLGAKAWDWKLNAYFVGADYDLKRDEFLKLLNQPGATWLTHPWLGQVWVRPQDWSVHESNDQGGYCKIGVGFAPGGRDDFAPSIDRADVSASATRRFADAAQAEFDMLPMSSASMTSMIATVQAQLDRVRNLIALGTLPLTWMNQVRNVIDGIKGDAAALLALPSAYSAALRSFSDLLGGGDTSGGYTSSGSASTAAEGVDDTAIPHVVDSLVATATLPVTMPGGAGDSPALHINLQREADLRSRLLLASACSMALTDYRSADDRDEALECVLKAMDAMLPSMPDAVFQAALDCRAALVDALLAQELEPAQVRDIVNPQPATVLAHRMEVDEAVFLARNKVRHPLFVRGRVYG